MVKKGTFWKWLACKNQNIQTKIELYCAVVIWFRRGFKIRFPVQNLIQLKNMPNFSINWWKKGLFGNFKPARIKISKKRIKCTVVIWFRRGHKSFILQNFKIRFARDLIQGNSLGFFSDPILGPFARIFFIFTISFLGKWQTGSRFFLLTKT